VQSVPNQVLDKPIALEALCAALDRVTREGLAP
jgi:hypothetical protein